MLLFNYLSFFSLSRCSSSKSSTSASGSKRGSANRFASNKSCSNIYNVDSTSEFGLLHIKQHELGAVHLQHIPFGALISRSVSVASIGRAVTFAVSIGTSHFHPALHYCKTKLAEDCMTICEGSELEYGA